MWMKIKNSWPTLLIILGAFVLFDIGLNLTLYNPTVITPVYSFFLKHHLLSPEGPGYPLVSIHKLNLGLYFEPRATVIGTVQEVVTSGDGDIHMNIQNKEGTLVVEIIPEYPLPKPNVGDKIRIWGVTRYDISHRWWELHPVIGWRKI